MQEHCLKTQLVDINYIAGPKNGLPILLLHGSTERWASMSTILDDLMAYLEVYATDFRGHGQSGRANGHYTMQDYADDTACFIKTCIKRPTILFGHSLGGMVALMVAAYFPELVQAIIIGDAPLSLTLLRARTIQQNEFAHQIIDCLRENKIDELYQLVKDDFSVTSLLACDPDILTAMFDRFDQTFSSYKPTDFFPKIKCPVLIIRGAIERGSLVTNADMQNAHAFLPHLQDVHLNHVGHSLFKEDKSAVLDAIKKFVTPL